MQAEGSQRRFGWYVRTVIDQCQLAAMQNPGCHCITQKENVIRPLSKGYREVPMLSTTIHIVHSKLLPTERRLPIQGMRLLGRVLICLPDLDRLVRFTCHQSETTLVECRAHDASLRLK
jgi:hypothetical protein